MTKRKPYKPCPDCGANLDPQERCDCQTSEPTSKPASDGNAA